MIVLENISLKTYNTFGLDYTADSMIILHDETEAASFFRMEKIVKQPHLILGGGSNILFTNDYKGIIIHPEFDGIRVESVKGDDVIVSSGAGINWDTLVEWTVENGFYGLENLSLIPGSVGASPVQNIGAYGSEVKDSIERVTAIRLFDGSVHEFSKSNCEFGYRNSIFKNREKGNYLVTRVYFNLSTRHLLNLGYGSLRDEIKKTGSESLKNARKAVIDIRRTKLPDPDLTGNAGSFFKNPVVSVSLAEDLKKTYTDMPLYNDMPGLSKLAAGWLIEQCGWKGKRTGDAGVHDKQALVLVNHGTASGIQLYELSEAIKDSVQKKFGISLEREVEVVGSI